MMLLALHVTPGADIPAFGLPTYLTDISIQAEQGVVSMQPAHPVCRCQCSAICCHQKVGREGVVMHRTECTCLCVCTSPSIKHSAPQTLMPIAKVPSATVPSCAENAHHSAVQKWRAGPGAHCSGGRNRCFGKGQRAPCSCCGS